MHVVKFQIQTCCSQTNTFNFANIDRKQTDKIYRKRHKNTPLNNGKQRDSCSLKLN